MNRLHPALLLNKRLAIAAGVVALVTAAAGFPIQAAAANSAVEPEVGSSATLPGMPPPPAEASSMPAPAPQSPSAAAPTAGAPVATAAVPPPEKTPPSPPVIAPASGGTSLAESGGTASLAVVKWSFSAGSPPDQSGGGPLVATAGRPLYLSLTVQGGEAAVDQLRTGGGIPIVVHWTRAGANAAKGAPDLTSELTIGDRGIASALAGEVEHRGHFDWHTWTRKDTLSPGQWGVSLTYPDGQPVMCGQSAEEPCRFSINVG
jgi:hypothetical protein